MTKVRCSAGRFASAGASPDDERTRRLLDRCAGLERPALMIRFSDDAFATVAGMRRFLAYYPRLSPQYMVFAPADGGVPSSPS